MLRFACPRCGKQLSAPDEKGGTNVVCPACRTSLQVPFPSVQPAGPAHASLPHAPKSGIPIWVWIVLGVTSLPMLSCFLCCGIARVGSGISEERHAAEKKARDEKERQEKEAIQKRLAEADRLWDAGQHGQANVIYKDLLSTLDAEAFWRVHGRRVQYERGQGNQAELQALRELEAHRLQLENTCDLFASVGGGSKSRRKKGESSTSIRITVLLSEDALIDGYRIRNCSIDAGTTICTITGQITATRRPLNVPGLWYTGYAGDSKITHSLLNAPPLDSGQSGRFRIDLTTEEAARIGRLVLDVR